MQYELYIELCLVVPFITVQYELFLVVSFTMKCEQFRAASFITVQYELYLAVKFVWAICAVSGSAILLLSYVLSYVWQDHLLLCNMSYCWQHLLWCCALAV